MEYTRNELIMMKAKLRRLLELERKYNITASYSAFASLVGISGAAVSLTKYLDKSMTGEDSLVVGTCCIAVAAMTGLFYKFVRKEGTKIEDDILESMSNMPDYVIEEVYEERGRRK